MSKTIKILNPKDKPFGRLSNNYVHYMKFSSQEISSQDTEKYRTVTNYIYANILKTPMYKQEIRATKKIRDIKPAFQHLYQLELNDIMRRATEKALKIKFDNVELAEKLLSTGNSPIFYISDNELLGTGTQNSGQNMYGKYLMQIRHVLRISSKKQKDEQHKSEHDQNIYNTYLAYTGLNKAIRGGNDLKQFIIKIPKEIIEIMGRLELEKTTPTRDTILQMEHRNMLSIIIKNAIKYPNTLVWAVRKEQMRDLRYRKIKERKNIIFDMYADYILEKKFPSLKHDQYTAAKKQQFDNMEYKQRNDLENRLTYLFEKGMLSDRLSNVVDERLAKHYIPSELDVIEAENIDAVSDENKPIVAEIFYTPEEGKPVLVYPFDYPNIEPQYKPYIVFSPVSLTGMLNIDSQLFPTVTHYMITRLIAYISDIGTMKLAYPYILSNPAVPIVGIESFLLPDNAMVAYYNLRDTNYHAQLIKYARLGMDLKFENRVLQDVLLTTGNSKLVYNDFSDPILGVGGRNVEGSDFVGRYLMKLRKHYATIRKDENITNLSKKDVKLILQQDPFMKEWLRMRVKDTCNVVMVMKNYLYMKSEINVELNSMFVETVIDNVYQPCSQVFAAANLITAGVPQFFFSIVRECPGFNSKYSEAAKVIWKRTAVMLYYMIHYMKDSSIQNIRSVLAKLEHLVSEGSNCVYIVEDKYDNCIISAILNILSGIIEFNKKLSYSTNITPLDVETAACIILNKDILGEIVQPTQEQTVLKEPKFIEKPGESEIIEESEFIEESEELEEPEFDQEFIFPEFPDLEEEEGEGEGEGEEEEEIFQNLEDNEKKDEQNTNQLIIEVLREWEDIKDPQTIANIIEGAVETIKTYPMSRQVKNNRVNFFATQR